VSLKRRIYGLPLLRYYREFRTAQMAGRFVDTSYGFRFAGSPDYLDSDWEPAERALIGSLLPKCAAFVDVGANHGIYSCLAAQSGIPAAALEPEEGNLRILKANLSQFENAELFPVAASDRTGILDLYGDGPTASLQSGWAGARPMFRQPVAANTLDNLIGHRWSGGRLFIKIDVEGAEDRVIAGASELLHRSPKPYWLIETFPGAKRDWIVEMFRAAGYDLYPVEWYNFLCTDDPDADTGPVSWMRYRLDGLNFEKTFDPPVSSWQAMEEIVAEARRRGRVFDDGAYVPPITYNP
jgi:FkbM family methyltransferase